MKTLYLIFTFILVSCGQAAQQANTPSTTDVTPSSTPTSVKATAKAASVASDPITIITATATPDTTSVATLDIPSVSTKTTTKTLITPDATPTSTPSSTPTPTPTPSSTPAPTPTPTPAPTVSNTSMTINGGATYTKSTTVTVTLNATNAAQQYVTNDSTCTSNGSWETYSLTKSWILGQTNTTARVYAKFRNSDHVESSCITASIIHDNTPPSNPSLIIYGNTSDGEGGSYTNSLQVTITISAVDADQMYITNTAGCTTNGSWEPYATSKAWTLAQPNTLNYVYMKVRDVATNETDCIATQIRHINTYDLHTATININWNGTSSLGYTSTQNVTLYLTAQDTDNITQVAISNGTTCTGTYEPFTANYTLHQNDSPGVVTYRRTNWNLSNTNGTAYVSALFKDAAGNISGCVLTSIQVVTMDNVANVFTGPTNSCIVSSTGQAKCFGRNDYGQLGYGYTQPTSASNGMTPSTVGLNATTIDVGTNRTIQQMSIGAAHTCALLDDGSVKCWGLNNYGQLGLGHTSTVTTMGDALEAVNLGGSAVSISSGYYHTCAIMLTGDVKCWGYNNFAQLGIGNQNNIGDTPNPVFTSVNLGTNKTAIQISAGVLFTCALLNDHTAKCWGYNSNKQLGQDIANYTGDGTNMIGNKPNQLGDNLPAIKVGSGKTINQLAAGSYHACALLNDGGVKCWGSYALGQLGYQTAGARDFTGDNRPYINFGPSSFSVAQISAGDFFTCAVNTDGNSKCWGSNTSGQLGQDNTVTIGLTNTMYDDTVFPFIQLGGSVTHISSHYSHSCVSFTNGTAKCWGNNAFGQLGVGSSNNMGAGPGEMLLIPNL